MHIITLEEKKNVVAMVGKKDGKKFDEAVRQIQYRDVYG
jgi:hypothetical protein